jgi:hypothetical protein
MKPQVSCLSHLSDEFGAIVKSKLEHGFLHFVLLHILLMPCKGKRSAQGVWEQSRRGLYQRPEAQNMLEHHQTSIHLADVWVVKHDVP